jgi:hypothetical protein
MQLKINAVQRELLNGWQGALRESGRSKFCRDISTAIVTKMRRKTGSKGFYCRRFLIREMRE